MAAPRVFISSTFYDLRQVRNNIGDFISSLGYEPIMHERSGVPYTQTEPLEKDCYHEVSGCDIVVCIIGNHFGSQSDENELSITMNEIKEAIKAKKKVYIFISNDVYLENRTYIINKDSGTFKSAYTDNIKIHEFIAELTENTKNHVIMPFETTDQIIDALKAQFAGLFQNLLQREASMTEAKTAYDIQESADKIREILNDFSEQKNEFFKKFDSSIYTTNQVLITIKNHLGMDKSSFFAKDIEALDEFMKLIGFNPVEVDDPFEDFRKYVGYNNSLKRTFVLKNDVVEVNGFIKDIRGSRLLNKYVIYNEEECCDFEEISSDDDLPF